MPYSRGFFRLPYEIGEVLAIKQSYRDVNKFYSTNSDTYPYGETMGAGWNNKLFVKNDLMPLQIKVTNIRVERLQDISEADCLAEGVNDCGFGFGIKGIKESGFIETARECYTTLIDKISGKGTWEFNPYAWVIEFELVKESDNEDNFAIKKEKGGQK